LPQTKVKVEKEEKSEQSEEKPKIEEFIKPSVTDIMQFALKNEEEEEQEVVDKTTDMTMKYLSKKDREKAKLVQETIKILPELAKSDNPLVAVMLDKLISGGGGGGSDLNELKEITKAMSYTIILPELMKDVARSIKGTPRENNADVLAMVMRILEERDKRLQELIAELKKEKENEAISELREEFFNSLNAVVETFSKSFEEIRSQMATMMSNNAQQSGDTMDEFDRLKNMLEKSRELLELTGHKVVEPGEGLDNVALGAKVDAEKEIRLKELELKRKEIEAKNQFYTQLGQAIAKLAENPDNILKLVNGVLSIFKGGPNSSQVANAMRTTLSNTPNINVQKPSTIPSLSSFVGEENESEG